MIPEKITDAELLEISKRPFMETIKEVKHLRLENRKMRKQLKLLSELSDRDDRDDRQAKSGFGGQAESLKVEVVEAKAFSHCQARYMNTITMRFGSYGSFDSAVTSESKTDQKADYWAFY